MLLIHGAHSTADAGPISATITALQRARVRVSAISLPGEVFVVGRTARETGGTCVVPESVEHLRAALLAHCKPPPRRADEAAADAEGRSRMVSMGFPRLVHSEEGFCACHGELRPRGYVCPRCGARMCELPSTCALCRLQLVSAPALARSYHHLFPVPAFVEVPDATRPALLPGRARAGAKASAGGAGHTQGSSSAALGAYDRSGGGGSDADAHAGGGPAAPQAAAAAAAQPAWVSPFNSGTAVPPATARLAPAFPDVDMQTPDADGEEEPPPTLVHDASRACGACAAALGAREPRFVCPGCRTAVCAPCEQLIHESLHSCPGCVGRGSVAA